LAVGDLEQGSAAFAQSRPRIVVAVLKQLTPLLVGKG
jgi:hypothetical protein